MKKKIFEYCEEGNLEKLQKCLTKKRLIKLDINQIYDGNTLLTATLENVVFTGGNDPKYISIVKELLNHPQIDINKANNKNLTPLMLACKSGNIETVELLINRKEININQEDSEGNTAFLFSCSKGKFKVMNMFFEHPDFIFTDKNKKDLTPLHYVCFSGRKKALKLLLEKCPNIDINARDWRGFTPLIAACNNSFLYDKTLKGIVEILLNNPNIDINAQSRETKVSALSLVARKNFEETCKLLVNHTELDVNLKNSQGESPFEIAYKAYQKDNCGYVAYRILYHPSMKTPPSVAFEFAANDDDLLEVFEKYKSVIKNYSPELKIELLGSLITKAFRKKAKAIVKFLIANFDISDETVFSCKIILQLLIDSCNNRSFDIAENILAKLTDLNFDDDFYTHIDLGDGALFDYDDIYYTLILKNYINTFKLLVKHPNANLDHGRTLFDSTTSLELACRHNRFKIIEIALTYLKGFQRKSTGNRRRRESPHEELMSNALKLSTDINVIKTIHKFLTPEERLKVFVQSIGSPMERKPASLDFVDCLLKCGGFDINAICNDFSPLYKLPINAACAINDISYLKLILTHPDINVNTFAPQEGTALTILSGMGRGVQDDPEKVRLIINHPCFDFNFHKDALWGSNPECFLVLYNSDIEIDFSNSIRDTFTLLTYACCFGQLEKLKVMLERTNLDPNIADKKNMSPLKWLINYDDPHDPRTIPMIKMLLDCKRIKPETVLDAYKHGQKYFSETKQDKTAILKKYLLNAGYDI